MQQAKGYQAKNGRPLSNEMQAATLRCTTALTWVISVKLPNIETG